MALYDPAADVDRYLHLTEQAEAIAAELVSIKTRLADQLPTGRHDVAGVTVAITPPARRFNLDKGLALLTDEQKRVCLVPAPAKVKAQLSQVLVDTCMDEGAGKSSVSIR